MSTPARNLTVNVRLDPLDGLNSLQSRKLSHDAKESHQQVARFPVQCLASFTVLHLVRQGFRTIRPSPWDLLCL